MFLNFQITKPCFIMQLITLSLIKQNHLIETVSLNNILCIYPFLIT